MSNKVKMTINIDYTKQVGDVIKAIFVADDKCHGNKGEHLTGVMMGFAPDIMGCLHNYRVLITTTIPITTSKLWQIGKSLEATYGFTEPSVIITSSKYVDYRSEMRMIIEKGQFCLYESHFGYKPGVHIVTLSISMGVNCKEKENE